MEIKIVWGAKPDIKGRALLGLDVEGTQHNVRLVQIASGNVSYLFDMGDGRQRDLAVEVLQDTRYEFVTHSRYDADTVWWSLGLDLTGRVRDTFLLACLVFPGEHNPHGLKPLSSALIDDELQAAETALHLVFKETYGGKKAEYLERGYLELDVHHPAYELYSAMDAVYCLELYSRLKDMGRVSSKVFFEQQSENDALGLASRRGVMVDKARTRDLLSKEQARLADANEEMRTLLDVPARSIKVGAWLEEQGVEFTERTDTDGPKLDKHALRLLTEQYPDGKVGDVLRARQKASKASNRVANMKNFLKYSEKDGFVHPDYKTAIAATGRMSVTNPAMQTLAKGDDETGLRGCFVARPGFVFVGADFDTQELRVAAALSGDVTLAERILGGEDLHWAAAWSVFGPEATKKQRDTVGKVLNFASLYGAGPAAIAKQTGLEVYKEPYKDWRTGEERMGWNGPAAEALRAWWDMYPVMKAWDRENRRKTRGGEWPDDLIELDSGRRIPVDYPHKTTNYFVQGTGRDITGKAIQIVEKLFPGALSLVIHDEILLEVPEDQVERGLQVLTQAMNFTFESDVFEGIPMPITATAEIIGDRWGKS